MTYEDMKIKHPDWNWQEAEEITEEDLLASVEYYDMMIHKVKSDITLPGGRGA